MFVPVLIGVAVVEVFAFIEVGRAIGWLIAVVLLLGTSVFGARMLLVQGRLTIQRVSLALSERRAPGNKVIDGALGFLGGMLLLIPGFVTDVLGVLLLLPLIQKLTRRWMSRHYAGRVMSFVATAGRFAPGDHGGRPADVESTLVEEDPDQLGR
ncbi:MAG: FxsA family protein [Solirubrobacteraceae bacterium]